MSVPKIVLKNGVSVPVVGLGTWRSPPEVVTQAVKDAIDCGYRHIDCAHIYGNEPQVGMAIEEKINEGVITRNDLFVTSKLWNTFHLPASVRPACETSLKNLRLKYLDNYLIHWPTAYKDGTELQPKDANGKIIFFEHDYVETWRAMEELVDAGLCRSIGISNFNKRQIERLLSNCRIPPANLQIECHPYLNQSRLISFCRANCIAVTAYSPLGSPHSPYEKPGEYSLMEHPTILQLARRHEKSPAQILIRYQVQRSIVVIPRSITKAHIAANLDICDFELSDQEMLELNHMDMNGRIMTWTLCAGHPHHPFENDEY